MYVCSYVNVNLSAIDSYHYLLGDHNIDVLTKHKREGISR